MSEHISLRIPIRVLAAFIFVQGIFRSCSRAVHIRTWQRRLHHLRGLSLQAFSELFQSGNTVYVMIMPLAKKRGWNPFYNFMLIPLQCLFSCDAGVFTVMHKVFRQCRGATIGHQISPMLAGLTVSIEEEIYVRHLQSFFSDNRELFFCTRYVDNRLVVVSRQLLQDRRLLHFLTNNFYQAPVELEHVTSCDALEEFLGFDLHFDHHRLQLILRPERWKIREPNSAGPERHRTAAFHSARLHIERHVWPPHVRDRQLVQLRQHFAVPSYHSL